MARRARYIILCACTQAMCQCMVFHIFILQDSTAEPPKKKRKVTDTHLDGDEEFRIDTEYEDNLEQLTTEWSKDKPSKKAVKTLMASSYEGRRMWIKHTRPVLQEILGKFPPLKRIIHVRIILLQSLIVTYFAAQIKREFNWIVKDELPETNPSGMYDRFSKRFNEMAEGVHNLALLESKTSGVLLTLLEKQEAEINSFEGSLSIVIIIECTCTLIFITRFLCYHTYDTVLACLE